MIQPGAMASNTEPTGHANWPAMEADYWQTTKKARDREDATLAHEHAVRQDQLDQGIIELYDRRSHLQRSIKELDANIEFRNAEKQRLLREFEMRRAALQAQRQDEDRSQQNWFARAKESVPPEEERATPEGKSGAPPNHARILPNPAANWTSINGPSLRRSSRVQEQRQEKRSDPGNLFGSVFHNPVDEELKPTSRTLPLRDLTTNPQPGMSFDPFSATNAEVPLPSSSRQVEDTIAKSKQERRSLPGLPLSSEVIDGLPESNRASSRGRKSLPSVRDPASHMNTPAPESTIADEHEITRESLVLKDNGSVITEPPMFAGVPLEKINENHPFWNPEWEPLERTVQAALDKWKDRLENLRNKPDAVRHTMFLANRQVNRGQSVLDFIRDGCFHPLQFASREMMDKYYKTFINYDTVFRLVNVHEELKKFDLGVTPLEWLRQRLYEIAMAQGDKFSLSKTTHDLYHDIKLKALREKHGFGNIGRPSGYKVGDKSVAKGTAKLKPKKETSEMSPVNPGESRRSSRRSIGQVDAEDDLQRPMAVSSSEYLEPVTPRLSKRQRLDTAENKAKQGADLAAQESEAIQADIEYEGYSSRDSFSNGRIMHLDFRVQQIKTRLLTTRPNVTQYWTWKSEDKKFEHQVLRDVQPNVTWGYYREPDRFSCDLVHIKEIRYASDGRKILVARTGENSGDVLVFFKRERTKKRFLAFVKKKGVQLVKHSHVYLEDAWNAMNSKMMSDDESET
ncbi:hypothetical protein F5B22DRAFT_42655 [Xylaria bambusicola]|uniref:uncharacterized protein n=1 Tax=Xylaria bambusicola TaxID=326684 RepID=UPI0020088336|nr:uncharacterized protein F5B22DRAFT_42655 [Xylaria bambusicola]KAI0502879.1 hypothetical protein F5B22DRAFT_42655 [Xylaria bambusicola]